MVQKKTTSRRKTSKFGITAKKASSKTSTRTARKSSR